MLDSDELKNIRKTFNGEKEFFLVNAFKAIGDGNRHRIFKLLHDRRQMSASDIATALKISRPLTSQHLKILEQAKLFKKSKVGLNRFYQLNYQNPLVKVLSQTINKFS